MWAGQQSGGRGQRLGCAHAEFERPMGALRSQPRLAVGCEERGKLREGTGGTWDGESHLTCLFVRCE